MNLAWISMEALNHEREGVHQLPQLSTGGQFDPAVDGAKVPEISTLHRLPAELVDDQIVIHAAPSSATSGTVALTRSGF